MDHHRFSNQLTASPGKLPTRGILLLAVMILTLLGSFFGCGNQDGSRITQVTVTQLRAELERDSTLALIDVRTPEEYNQVRVPHIKARIDYAAIAAKIDTIQFPKDRPVYLICRTGRRSLIAAKELLDLGYQSPINVAGGTVAWDQAGYPLIKR